MLRYWRLAIAAGSQLIRAQQSTAHCAAGGSTAAKHSTWAKDAAAATSDPKTQELRKVTSKGRADGGVITSDSATGGEGEDGRARSPHRPGHPPVLVQALPRPGRQRGGRG